MRFQKSGEVDWLYLCLQQFDKFLNMKQMRLPETEESNGNNCDPVKS